MQDAWWMRSNVEGSGHGLVSGDYHEMSWETWGKEEESQTNNSRGSDLNTGLFKQEQNIRT
jgi:hypothetical protein